MAHSPRRFSPASTFSLSFLDVIACATGITIFITIMMLIVTERSVPADLQKQYQEARSNQSAQQRILDEAKELETAGEKLAGLEQELASITRRETQAQSAMAAIRTASALRQDIQRLQNTPAESPQIQSVQTMINRRSPFLRTSMKRENVWFFFHKPGYVRVIERSNGEFRSSHFQNATTPLSRHTRFEAVNDGITVDQLIETGGISRQKYRSFDRDREYIGCYVNPIAGCHEDFVKVREVLYQANIEVGFRFELDHDLALFGPDGRQAPVQ